MTELVPARPEARGREGRSGRRERGLTAEGRLDDLPVRGLQERARGSASEPEGGEAVTSRRSSPLARRAAPSRQRQGQGSGWTGQRTHVREVVRGPRRVRVALRRGGSAVLLLLLGGHLGLRRCVSVDGGELGRDGALGGRDGGRVGGRGCSGRAHGGLGAVVRESEEEERCRDSSRRRRRSLVKDSCASPSSFFLSPPQRQIDRRKSTYARTSRKLPQLSVPLRASSLSPSSAVRHPGTGPDV